MRVHIAPSEVLSWMVMTVTFSCDKDLIEQIEDVSDKLISILNVFYREVENVKITMDVNYSLVKEVEIILKDFEKVLDMMEYSRKRTSKNEFRKFNILKKHNVTSLISVRDLENILEYNVSVSVENIVINASNFKDEFVNSLYFYALEYSKLHYNVIKSKDVYYLESNAKFYESLNKL